MTVEVVFNFENHTYKLSHPFKELDRNYSDESYAYFIEERSDTENGFFEVNLLKDETTNKIIEDGYVAVYDNIDQTSTDILINAIIKLS